MHDGYVGRVHVRLAERCRDVSSVRIRRRKRGAPFPFVTPASLIELAEDAAVDSVRLKIDPRTTTLAGIVVDETGAPAMDARVSATGHGSARKAWLGSPTATTDATGRFRFDGLPPGDYDVEAETLHDSRSAKRLVTAGASDVVLTLASPVCNSGVAFDPPHKPASPIIWDDKIELVGWNMPGRARVGESIQVTLVFRVRAPIVHAWNVFAHFDSGAHRENADHSAVSESCPTTTWKPGDVLVDRFSTTLRFPEPFMLRVGFFRATGQDTPSPWENLVGAGDAGGVQLGTIEAAAD